MRDIFDIVVVGAGPGGCATAARIADARPSWRVALIETGPARPNMLSSVPAGIIGLIGRRNSHNYAYDTVTQNELRGRRGFQPRGRGVGGSSLINAMVYIRGQREDYDGWAAAGCHGWSWNDVLPLFRRAEHNTRGADALHGEGGPLHIDDLWSDTPITRSFLDAAVEAGYSRNPDFNGPVQEGVGTYQVTQKLGRRFDAGSAYVYSKTRGNLAVIADTQALRLTFEGRRATGVVVRSGKGERTITATREIVLAGGAFGTPQLLLLSGVGPAEQVRRHGITVVADRAQVGENLQDHIDHTSNRVMRGAGVVGLTPGGLSPLIKGIAPFVRKQRSALTTNFAEAGGFVRSSPNLDRPDLQLHFVTALVDDHGRKRSFKTGMSLHVCLLRPESRGTVRLTDANPESSPRIDPRYLSHPNDVTGMVRGVRIAENILDQPSLARFGGKPLHALDAGDDDAIIDSLRRRADTIYHPVGTCRMGSDDESVVDSELRVRGVDGLRIADASIMPTLISGNTQAPTAMIGERAADLIVRASNA